MRFYTSVLIAIIAQLFCAPGFAGIGSIDNRERADWKDYSHIVHIQSFITNDEDSSFFTCTGEYVAPNIVLVAAHCVVDDDGSMYSGQTIAVTNAGKKCRVERTFYPTDYRANVWQKDWALLLLANEEGCYSDDVISLSGVDKYNVQMNVLNIGFGSLTLLKDEEIHKLKQIYQECSGCSTDVLEEKFDAALGHPLKDKFDLHVLKKQSTCRGEKQKSDLVVADCDGWQGNSGGPLVNVDTGKLIAVASAANGGYDFDDNRVLIGGPIVDFFEKHLADIKTMYPSKPESEPLLVHNDDIDNLGDVAVVEPDNGNKTPESEDAAIMPQHTEEVKLDAVAIADQQNKKDQNVVPQGSNTNTSELHNIGMLEKIKSGIAEKGAKIAQSVAEKIKKKQDKLAKVEARKDSLTDAEFIHEVLEPVTDISDLKELEEAYKKAKDREKSFENRMLSGLTMAATGIGGMMLAQGLAEKKADEKAEADMRAYLSTFQCKIGEKGKSYTGGTKSIETPGANQLINLYQEYASLALDLKERKTALGMKPGIESQVVIDKATTGLYENQGQGLRPGAYASIARALQDANSEDAKKWATQLESAKKKTKTGAIVGGVGAVGGAAGNLLINKDMYFGDK